MGENKDFKWRILIAVVIMTPFVLLLTIGPMVLGGNVALACFAGYMQLLMVVGIIWDTIRKVKIRRGLWVRQGRVCSCKQVGSYYFDVVEYEFDGQMYQADADPSDFHYTPSPIGAPRKVYIDPQNPSVAKQVGSLHIVKAIIVIIGVSLFLDTMIFLLLFL